MKTDTYAIYMGKLHEELHEEMVDCGMAALPVDQRHFSSPILLTFLQQLVSLSLFHFFTLNIEKKLSFYNDDDFVANHFIHY